jgi:hypothetical protein
MAWDDLSEKERQEMARLLRQAIDIDRYPFSPKVKRWKAMLAKLEPPLPKPEPYPAPKPSAEPSLLYQKLRGGDRRRR